MCQLKLSNFINKAMRFEVSVTSSTDVTFNTYVSWYFEANNLSPITYQERIVKSVALTVWTSTHLLTNIWEPETAVHLRTPFPFPTSCFVLPNYLGFSYMNKRVRKAIGGQLWIDHSFSCDYLGPEGKIKKNGVSIFPKARKCHQQGWRIYQCW